MFNTGTSKAWMANTRRKGKENEKTVMWPSAWPYYIRDVPLAPAVLRSMAVCQKVKGLVIFEEMRNTKIHLWDLASECKKPSGKWHKGQGEFLWDWQGDSSESHLSVRRRSVRWHQTQHFDMNSWQQLKTWAAQAWTKLEKFTCNPIDMTSFCGNSLVSNI